MELANRTVLITGATAGIGLACAESLPDRPPPPVAGRG